MKRTVEGIVPELLKVTATAKDDDSATAIVKAFKDVPFCPKEVSSSNESTHSLQIDKSAFHPSGECSQ